MKYTKEYLKKHPTAVFVGNNADIIARVKSINGHSYTDHPVYKEKHCINLMNSCHSSKEWYEKNGYTVITLGQFLLNINSLAYEIY